MQTTHKRVQPIHLTTLAMRLVITLILVSSTFVIAQDSPGRFELGGEYTVPHNLPSGPGISGDVNFGRHIALDASYSLLPSGGFHAMTGFFGAKAGVRKEHFGVFGKVRPGFFSLGNTFRGATIVSGPDLNISQTNRLARENERALDIGGVVEYYPARHWALRWDFSDMMIFQEPLPATNVVIVGNGIPITGFPSVPLPISHTFLFSSGIHYRF